jgi:hypothetical protein
MNDPETFTAEIARFIDEVYTGQTAGVTYDDGTDEFETYSEL